MPNQNVCKQKKFTYVHTYSQTTATLATVAGCAGNTNLVLFTYMEILLYCHMVENLKLPRVLL